MKLKHRRITLVTINVVSLVVELMQNYNCLMHLVRVNKKLWKVFVCIARLAGSLNIRSNNYTNQVRFNVVTVARCLLGCCCVQSGKYISTLWRSIHSLDVSKLLTRRSVCQSTLQHPTWQFSLSQLNNQYQILYVPVSGLQRIQTQRINLLLHLINCNKVLMVNTLCLTCLCIYFDVFR